MIGGIIVTARIRRMGEGTIFTLCVSPHLDWGGVPQPRSGLGKVPHPRSGWGVPIPGLDRGSMSSQVCMGDTSISGLDPSQVWTGGAPSQVWMGVPHPRSGQGMGVPHPRSALNLGYPPGQDWMGYPPPGPGLDGVPPPKPSDRAALESTCYAAGGMPLAFTQEDFLVLGDITICIFSCFRHWLAFFAC